MLNYPYTLNYTSLKNPTKVSNFREAFGGSPRSVLTCALVGIFDMLEQWKDIKGFPNYKISSLGRICSVSRTVIFSDGRKRRYEGRLLSPHITKSGYYQYVLYVKPGTNPKAKSIHRLVGEAFIPNPGNKRTINHKNGVKTDNRASNLEWCSYSENHLHAYRLGLKKGAWTGKYGSQHPCGKGYKKSDK